MRIQKFICLYCWIYRHNGRLFQVGCWSPTRSVRPADRVVCQQRCWLLNEEAIGIPAPDLEWSPKLLAHITLLNDMLNSSISWIGFRGDPIACRIFLFRCYSHPKKPLLRFYRTTRAFRCGAENVTLRRPRHLRAGHRCTRATSFA